MAASATTAKNPVQSPAPGVTPSADAAKPLSEVDKGTAGQPGKADLQAHHAGNSKAPTYLEVVQSREETVPRSQPAVAAQRPMGAGAELFKDNANPQGLGERGLAMQQGQNMGNCHMIAALHNLSLKDAGRQLLSQLVNRRSDGQYEVTVHDTGKNNSNLTAKVVVPERNLKWEGQNQYGEKLTLGTMPPGAAAIQVADGMYRQERERLRTGENGGHFAGHMASGTFAFITLHRLTGNRPGSVDLSQLPNAKRDEFVKETLLELAKHQDRLVIIGTMASGEELKSRGITPREDGLGFLRLPMGTTNATRAPGARVDPTLPYVIGHAHSISIDAVKQQVTVVNPWNTERRFTLTFREFGSVFAGIDYGAITPNTPAPRIKDSLDWMSERGIKIEESPSR